MKAKKTPGLQSRLLHQLGFSDGFLISLDQCAEFARSSLESYGVDKSMYSNEEEMMAKLFEMQVRVLKSSAFKNGKAIGVTLPEGAKSLQVDEMPLPKFAWSTVGLVPIVSIDRGLADEKDGVRLMNDIEDLPALLDSFVEASFFGVKFRGVIHSPNSDGIHALVAQLFDFARIAVSKNLTPVLQPEVDMGSPERPLCEQLLLEALLEGMQNLDPADHVVFELTIPTKPNVYLPLVEHPQTLRVGALSGGYALSEACRKLTQNIGMIAWFGRAAIEGLQIQHSDEEFDNTLNHCFSLMFQASRPTSTLEEQRIKAESQDGFFVSLDANDVDKELEQFGIEFESLSMEEKADKLFDMHVRIVSSSKFNGSRVIGCVLRQETMQSDIDDFSMASYLWDEKRIAPFLRVDSGLQKECDGVQLMVDIANLDEMLESVAIDGICGTKTGIVIHQPNVQGIRAAVQQQVSLAKVLVEKGLLPILQFLITKDADKKLLCERYLFEALIDGLGNLKVTQKVILEVTVPELPNTYLPLSSHPNVLRICALSGGKPRAVTCEGLAMNVGLIAGFGRGFTEGIREDMDEDEFNQTLDDICKAMYEASFAVPTKEEQTVKVGTMEGFFAAFDHSGTSEVTKALQGYGVDTSDLKSNSQLNAKLHEMHTMILTHEKFNGSRVIGVTLAEEALTRKIHKVPIARYLWEQKNIVPFLKVGKGLEAEKDGVQLCKTSSTSNLDDMLSTAYNAGYFGTKARSVIKSARPAGIAALVDQQFRLGKQVMQKGLTPILMIEVDINAKDKAACERMLVRELMRHLSGLKSNEKVVFQLSLPSQSNLYLPLMAYPNTIRVVALSGGYGRSESCKMLGSNVGMVAGFSRALVEGLTIGLSKSQFSRTLDNSCKLIFSVSRVPTALDEQLAKVSSQEGFFAALDGGASNDESVLKTYGVRCEEDEIQDQAHQMRARFITNPKFNGARAIGMIFSEEMMDRDIDYMPSPKYLWEVKKVVPILRIDSALNHQEVDGCQAAWEIPRLNQLLDKALANGVYFVKTNASIRLPNAAAIKRLIESQFDFAKKVIERGLVPVIQLSVALTSPDMVGCEQKLRQALMGSLNRDLQTGQRVVLVLGIPTKPDMYSSIAQHLKVIRCALVSGGYDRKAACAKLRACPNTIASFGRAFTEGMTVNQTDKEFTRIVDESCAEIYEASVSKDAPPDPAAAAGGGEDTTPRASGSVSSMAPTGSVSSSVAPQDTLKSCSSQPTPTSRSSLPIIAGVLATNQSSAPKAAGGKRWALLKQNTFSMGDRLSASDSPLLGS